MFGRLYPFLLKWFLFRAHVNFLGGWYFHFTPIFHEFRPILWRSGPRPSDHLEDAEATLPSEELGQFSKMRRDFSLHSLKTNIPKRKPSYSIHFQVRTVSFREGSSSILTFIYWDFPLHKGITGIS